MKQFSQTLLTLFFFLLTLSFSIQTFAQSGSPSIRREAQGGGGQGEDCIPNGEDYVLKFVISLDAVDLPFLHTCDLHFGIDMLTSDMIYVAAPFVAFYQNPRDPNEYIYNFQITLTAAEIEEMCNTKDYRINIDLFCLEYDVMESTTNGNGFDFGINLCCINGNGLDRISNNEINIFTFDSKEESTYAEKINKNQFSDYYIYDLQGNQIDILKDQSTNVSLEEHISNLYIKTGIYLVRFWNGKEMKTTKVFKL